MRNSARALLLPTPVAEAAGVMSISALPGNDTIARGSDIAITAELHGFKSAEAFVVVKDEKGEWKRWAMSAAQRGDGFEAVLFDIAANTQYYVESREIRTPTYTIHVADAPFVRSLALEFVYPAYTGMANKRVEDGGDIVAPKGTLVRVIASPSAPVTDGRLELDDARTIRMQPNAAGELVASMRVLKDGLYHIELPGLDGRLTNASAQYAITALADEPPTVRVEKPGRDIKVSTVDEVFVSATAEDDYGVTKLDLVYSVNGAAQQTKALARPGTRSASVTGAHTFFLEELSLKPGDFVSYFVRATDNNAADGAKSATTDIYFIQIRPFSREYRAAEQAGMPGQGQGMEDPGALSEQQRQIIAATFNIQRDRATYTAQGYREALTTVELSQKRVREQVETLLRRMQQREVVQMDSIFAQIAQLLPQATREMGAAEEQLQKQRPDDALAPEQRALQQLLRAEALYREVQVQMQQQQQASGQGGTPPEDLADLFDLEREGIPNQYEQVQRSQQQQQQQRIDETLERLRELARRQQQEAERQQQQGMRGQQQQQQGGGGTGSAQRRLADEAEEQARQLERLAREQSNPELSEAARRLREAADAMRRASAQRDGRGLADAQAARERLAEAQRRLQQNQRESLQQRVEDARQRAEQLREQQRNIAGEAENASGSQNMEQLRRLNDQKNQLGTGIAELESRLDRMSAEARNSNRQAARDLQAAADAIRDSRVRERIRATQQQMQARSREFNRAQEEQIARDLDRVAQQLSAASSASSGQSAESQAGQAAERARQLAQSAQNMSDRARQATETPQGATAQGASRAGSNNSEVQRQLRAEAAQRAGEVRELQRQLRQQGADPSSLEQALSALQALQSAGPYNDAEEVQQLLAKVARGLQDFEYDLRQALQEAEKQKLFLSAPGQVPVQYQKAVEDYYRALARKRQ
jgi:hypothetical protein